MKNRADVVLYKEGYVESIKIAQSYIMQGLVLVNEEKVNKAGDMIKYGSSIRIKGKSHKYVSRGGLKLEKAIKEFNIDLNNKICMDIGASTGGFTHCMLKNNCGKVYAVDVGYGQLDWGLRNNEKVVVMERTNIRDVKIEDLTSKLDFIATDVSFISLKLVLPIINEFLKEEGSAVILIKPQFEAKREDVGEGGIIKNSEIHKKVIKDIFKEIEDHRLGPVKFTFSPITGATGNIEFLAMLKKDSERNNNINIDKVVDLAHEELS